MIGIPATYVTVSDSGEIRSSCMLDLTQEFPYVYSVELLEVDIDNVIEEYVENNGEKITTFFTEDGIVVEDGEGFEITSINSDSKLYKFLTDKED